MSLQGPGPLWLSTAIRLCPISFPRLGYNCSFFHHFSPSSIKDMHEASMCWAQRTKEWGRSDPLEVLTAQSGASGLEGEG